MFSKIPTAIMKMTREVPPALIKGRVWPVGGTELVATPMLTATCRASTRVIPPASRLPNRSLHRAAMRIPRHITKKYAPISSTHPTNPSSSPMMEKMKSLSP